jgi:WD40 repeat protein
LQLWDLTSKRMLAIEPAITNCRTFTFSSDSRKIVVGQFPRVVGEPPEPILVYDLPSGKQMKSLPTAWLPWGLELDPSGLKLAISTAEDKSVIVRDMTTGQVIWSLAVPFAVNGMAWNAGGSLLAAAGGDGNIYVWDMNLGKLVQTFSGHRSSAIRVTFNQRGNLLASTGWDGRLRLWNVLTGDEICNWPFEWEQYHVKFSSDDSSLSLFGGTTRTLFKIDGNAETNVLKFINTGNEELWSCAYSADGQVLASTHPDGVRFWDRWSGSLVGFQAANYADTVAFDRQGQVLFVDSRLGLLQYPITRSVEGGTNKLILGAPEHLNERHNFDRYCRPFDQKPTTAAMVSGGKVYLVELATHREKNMLTSAKPIDYASLSNDGRWCAASGYNDTNLTIFDLNNSLAVKVLPVPLQMKTMAFSPDSRWLVTGDTGQYQVWDTTNWKRAFVRSRNATAAGPGVIAFSSDSRTVAVARSAQLICLMDVATGAELATLESSLPQNIAYMEFSPDGNELAVIGEVRMHYLQLWDLRQLRKELKAINLDW